MPRVIAARLSLRVAASDGPESRARDEKSTNGHRLDARA
jgi:hypothetical protein